MGAIAGLARVQRGCRAHPDNAGGTQAAARVTALSAARI
jgi:hypothetical protein